MLHGLGLAGLWTPGCLRVVTLGFAVFGIAPMARSFRLPAVRPLVLCAAVPLLLGFVMTRLPDTDDDPRTYHFAAPEAYLRLHKIHAEPLNVNWHMPIAASMLFGAGWAWDDIEGAKLVNLAALVALLLGTAALAGALAPAPAAAPLAALLIGCTGLGLGQVWQGKDDVVLAAHAAWALWGAVTGRWAVAALLLGFGCSVKFTGGFVVAAIIASAAIGAKRPGPGSIPIVSILFLSPLLGWLLSSWLFLGNPVHPFLSGVFPDLGWNPEYQRALHHVMAVLTGAGTLTVTEGVAGVWRGWGDPALGQPVLLAAGLAGIMIVRSPHRRPLAAVLVLGYVLWLLTERNPRYLFPFAAILAAFGGAVLARAGRVAAAVLMLGSLAVPAGAALRLGSRDGVPLLAGRLSRDGYLARRFTTWDAVRRWTNVNVPADSTVVLTGEERRLWFAPRVRSGFTVHEPVLWRWSNDASSADRMRIKARQMRVAAVVHNFMSAEFRALTRFPGPGWTGRQLAVYREFAGRWLRPVRLPARVDRDGGGFIVYAISPAPGPLRWPVFHLPQTEGLAATAWVLAGRGDRVGAAAARRAVAARLDGVMVSRLHLAMAAELEGSDDGVYRELAPVVAAGFIGVNALERFGGAALATGRVREGLAAFSRAWRLSREDSLLLPYAYGLYRRAVGHMNNRRPAKAREDLLVADRLAPGQPSVVRALAAVSARR